MALMSEQGEIEELIRQIAAEGISVLYISSETDELVRGCDRVLVLREGKNTAEFIGDQISADNIMRAYAESKHA